MKKDMVVENAYGDKIKMEQGLKLIVTFSKDYAKYQKTIRNEQWQRAQHLINLSKRY